MTGTRILRERERGENMGETNRANHIGKTVDFVREDDESMREVYMKLNRAEMNIWE